MSDLSEMNRIVFALLCDITSKRPVLHVVTLCEDAHTSFHAHLCHRNIFLYLIEEGCKSILQPSSCSKIVTFYPLML